METTEDALVVFGRTPLTDPHFFPSAVMFAFPDLSMATQLAGHVGREKYGRCDGTAKSFLHDSTLWTVEASRIAIAKWLRSRVTPEGNTPEDSMIASGAINRIVLLATQYSTMMEAMLDQFAVPVVIPPDSDDEKRNE